MRYKAVFTEISDLHSVVAFIVRAGQITHYRDPAVAGMDLLTDSSRITRMQECLDAQVEPRNQTPRRLKIQKQLSTFVGPGHHRRLYKSSSPL